MTSQTISDRKALQMKSKLLGKDEPLTTEDLMGWLLAGCLCVIAVSLPLFLR